MFGFCCAMVSHPSSCEVAAIVPLSPDSVVEGISSVGARLVTVAGVCRRCL